MKAVSGSSGLNIMKASFFKKVSLFSFSLACALACSPVFAQNTKTPPPKIDKAPVPAPASTPEVKSAAKQDLPPAREIIERSIKEMGGAEAYKKHKSQHAVGTVEMPAQQIKGTLEAYAADPNKMLLKVNLPGVGDITTGYDGSVGYMLNPLTGPMLLQDKMLDQVATQADFNHILHSPENYKSMETLDLVKFEGEDCYKVKTVDKSDLETIEYYSKATGLQRGSTMSQESPFGAVPVSTVISEYKKFDNFLMPSVITQKMSGMEQVMKMDKMEFDTVPADTFDLPKEIKALIKK